jgi:hypothetical protein
MWTWPIFSAQLSARHYVDKELLKNPLIGWPANYCPKQAYTIEYTFLSNSKHLSVTKNDLFELHASHANLFGKMLGFFQCIFAGSVGGLTQELCNHTTSHHLFDVFPCSRCSCSF